MFKVPEENRVLESKFFGKMDASLGNNGLFKFRFNDLNVNCIVSDGAGWEHVSVTINKEECPNWETMNFIKNKFWGKEDVVIQFHPAESHYINYHKYCLHLWRPNNINITTPPSILVG